MHIRVSAVTKCFDNLTPSRLANKMSTTLTILESDIEKIKYVKCGHQELRTHDEDGDRKVTNYLHI